MPAIKRALEQINISDEQIKSMIALIDGNTVRGFDGDVVPITEGDSQSISVAAASILARVSRDRLCLEFNKKYPQYGFAKHKGYPTKEHRDNIIKYSRYRKSQNKSHKKTHSAHKVYYNKKHYGADYENIIVRPLRTSCKIPAAIMQA